MKLKYKLSNKVINDFFQFLYVLNDIMVLSYNFFNSTSFKYTLYKILFNEEKKLFL